MTEATILKWLKQEGEHVEGWEGIVEMMTDKINMEVEPQITGTLLKILAREGDIIPVGGPVAIIGAAIMVVAGVLPWDRAVTAVDAHTLVLLFGMMIVAAYLRLSGFFHLVTHWAVRRARSPVGLLAMVALAAGMLSALFVNDVICLVLAPVVLLFLAMVHAPTHAQALVSSLFPDIFPLAASEPAMLVLTGLALLSLASVGSTRHR